MVLVDAVRARSFDITLRHGLSSTEVERRLYAGRSAEDAGTRAVAFYLADMRERGLHQDLGFSSAERFADVRLGLAPSTVRERIATGIALEELPEIDRAFREGRLFWSAVRELVRVATAETDAAWAAWAERRTAREVIAEVKARAKGELPTDPARRRTHTSKIEVRAKLDVLQWEVWSNARAKFEAESGGPVSDAEILVDAARLVLQSRPDGTVPGRTPVNDGHFRIQLSHCERCRTSRLHTEEGEVELDPATARVALIEAGRGDLAPALEAQNGAAPDPAACPSTSPGASPGFTDDGDENTGPPIAPELRDAPTSEPLRRTVLARDGYRCLCCASKRGLTVHHKRWRSYGGRSEESNLVTLCERCHSLVHDRLLVLRGSVPGVLRFCDRRGRDLHGRGEDVPDVPGAIGAMDVTRVILNDVRSEGEVPPRALDARATRVRFQDLPSEVDPQWWVRHRHLFDWHEGHGTLDFEPGVAMPEAEEASPPVAGADHGRARARDARASRPRGLGDVVGQKRAVDALAQATLAARKTGEPIAHVLLTGPPGLGKTSLAHAVAGELGSRLLATSGPVVREPSVLLGLLTSLGPGDVLLLDEIHRLPPRVAELLYEALEDRLLSLPVRCGMHQSTLHVRLAPWTLIGATSEEHLLPAPLLGRFPLRVRLKFYDTEELAEIVRGAAVQSGVEIEDAAARSVARASRDTPREALALFRSVRDAAVVSGAQGIDEALVARALERLGVDEHGLGPAEREYLDALRRAGRPLGLATLAGRLAAPSSTLQQVVEPFLLRRELIRLTPHGRAATP